MMAEFPLALFEIDARVNCKAIVTGFLDQGLHIVAVRMDLAFTIDIPSIRVSC